MAHVRGTLYWTGLSTVQARGVVRRADINSELFSIAMGRFMSEDWNGGPSIYIIDTSTDKAARIDNQGAGEYDVKVSSRTGTEVFDDLLSREESYDLPRKFWVVDKIIVMD